MHEIHKNLHQTHQQALSQGISVISLMNQHSEYHLPPHQHEHGQLVMALKGAVRCEIGQQVWWVPTNAAVWLAPNTMHSHVITANAQVCVAFVQAQEALANVPSGTIGVSALFKQVLLALAQEAAHLPLEHRQLLLKLLVWELKRAPTQAFAIDVLQNPRLQNLYQAALSAPMHLPDGKYWAEKLAMSERTLLRLVKQDTGLSFARWRQQVQLMASLMRLSEGASVQQVAMDLGYESVSAFIKVFKKRLGQTPKRYVLQTQGVL